MLKIIKTAGQWKVVNDEIINVIMHDVPVKGSQENVGFRGNKTKYLHVILYVQEMRCLFFCSPIFLATTLYESRLIECFELNISKAMNFIIFFLFVIKENLKLKIWIL